MDSPSSRARRKQHSLLDDHRGSTWWAPGAIGWWIGVLFAIGSLCFAAGAAPGYVEAVGALADAAQVRNVALMNLGTFVGAVCFFVGAVLLLPERTRSHPQP